MNTKPYLSPSLFFFLEQQLLPMSHLLGFPFESLRNVFKETFAKGEGRGKGGEGKKKHQEETGILRLCFSNMSEVVVLRSPPAYSLCHPCSCSMLDWWGIGQQQTDAWWLITPASFWQKTIQCWEMIDVKSNFKHGNKTPAVRCSVH